MAIINGHESNIVTLENLAQYKNLSEQAFNAKYDTDGDGIVNASAQAGVTHIAQIHVGDTSWTKTDDSFTENNIYNIATKPMGCVSIDETQTNVTGHTLTITFDEPVEVDCELIIQVQGSIEGGQLGVSGHEMITTTTELEGLTELSNKVVDAYVVKQVMGGATGDFVTTSDMTTAINNALSTAQSYTNTEIGKISRFSLLVYGSYAALEAIPSAERRTDAIYLIPSENPEEAQHNIKSEYICVDGNWELVGSTQVQLENYAEKGTLPVNPTDAEKANMNIWIETE